MTKPFKIRVTQRSKILKFEDDYIHGKKTAKKISELTECRYSYVKVVLNEYILVNVPASKKEQENNLKLLEVLKNHSKVKEIKPPNYENYNKQRFL